MQWPRVVLALGEIHSLTKIVRLKGLTGASNASGCEALALNETPRLIAGGPGSGDSRRFVRWEASCRVVGARRHPRIAGGVRGPRLPQE